MSRKMGKQTIITALKNFETTFCAEIFEGSVVTKETRWKKLRKAKRANVGTKPEDAKPSWKKLRKTKLADVCDEAEDAEPAGKILRKTKLANVCDETQPQQFHEARFKGLENLGNTCYFQACCEFLN